MANGSSESEEDFTEPKLPLTVDSPIAWAEVLIDHAALSAFYKEHGVHCFDCCAAEAETFAEGAKVHEGGPYGGFDAQKIVDGLNELAKQHPVQESDLQPRSLLKRAIDLMFSGPKQ